MTIAPHRTETVAEEPLELLRSMLEEQFVLQTDRLTELTVYGRLPGHGGYDPHTLDILATAARQAIADTAQALRRMSEGTYGRCAECHRPIPLGRLHAVPHARYCTRCHRGTCQDR
jgi:RNA polymerase-binding transcription factor DksA